MPLQLGGTMYTISAKNLIQTGFSIDDAKQLVNEIEKALLQTSDDEKIVIDFTDVKFFTTQFFNNSVGKYVLKMSPCKFNKKFEIKNLSSVGQSTFQHSYDNAVSYYKLPPDKRLEQDEIIDQSEEF